MSNVIETREYPMGDGTKAFALIRDDGFVGFHVARAGIAVPDTFFALGAEVMEQLARLARDHATPEATAQLARLDGR